MWHHRSSAPLRHPPPSLIPQHLFLPRIPSFPLPLHTQPFWSNKQNLWVRREDHGGRIVERTTNRHKRFSATKIRLKLWWCCCVTVIKKKKPLLFDCHLALSHFFLQLGMLWLSAWGNAAIPADRQQGKQESKTKGCGGGSVRERESGEQRGAHAWVRLLWGGGIFSSEAIYFYHLARTKVLIGSSVLGRISFMRGAKPESGWFTAKSQQQQNVTGLQENKTDRSSLLFIRTHAELLVASHEVLSQ